MKKFLLTILVTMVCSVCFAQTEHMKFKGIPITGPLMSFVTKLKAKGFTYLGTEQGVAMLKGEFATIKGCTVGVATFEGKDQVNTVVAILPEQKLWSEVSGDYFGMKKFLTEKYGNPESVENFSGKNPADDWFKFHSILDGECNYISEFKCPNGIIQLSIKKMDYNTASTYLKYIDDANAEELHKKIMDDL